MVTKYLYLCILYIIAFHSVLGHALVKLSSTYGLELVVDSFSTSYCILSPTYGLIYLQKFFSH